MFNFREMAAGIRDEIVENRRELHRNPEPGLQEAWTTAFIRNKLQEYGVEVLDWGGETGVVGLLRGGRPSSRGTCVALRADIDALPIEQQAEPGALCSQRPGFMHACGHDTHMAALLGAARLLVEKRAELRGTVKFIFQPGEEVMRGAESMIEAGVLDNPKVDFIYGMHCSPQAEAGTIMLPYGALTAATADTLLKVQGQGGHGALPHLAKDPVLASSAMVMALQSIVSREICPGDAAVVTFGSIHGGTVGNVIADSVELKGTVRAVEMDVFNSLEGRMRRIIDNTAEAYRVSADFRFTPGVPSCVNPPEWSDRLGAPDGPLANIYGLEKVLPFRPVMVGEDFSRFQQKIPGIFCWFGVGNQAKGISASLHNPKFQADENALPLAAAVHAQVAMQAADWF